MLFRYSAIRQPNFSLRLDGQFSSLVLLHCNASRKPRAGLNTDHDFFIGQFDLTMDCTIENPYPTEQFRLETILEPYLNVALKITTTDENADLQDQRRINYNVLVSLSFTESLLMKIDDSWFTDPC